MYIQIHTFTYTYIHIHTYTCIYVHMHTYTYIYRHRLTNTCVYMHIPTHTYIYIHIQTDTHIYIHIHTYTCIVNGSTSAMMIVPKTLKERRYQSLSNRPRSRTANCLFQAELQGRSRHGKCPKWTKQEGRSSGF